MYIRHPISYRHNMTSLGWSLLAVPFLIALNAFFVAAEYALVATGPIQIDQLRRRNRHRAAAAESLSAQPASAIGTIQVCITMTNLLLGWIGEPAISAVLETALGPLIARHPIIFKAIGVFLSFLIITLLTVVWSELLPKALTLRYVVPALALTAVPVLFIQHAFKPIVWLMNKMANLLTLPLGLGRVEEMEKQEISLDDVKLLAMRAGDEGLLTPRERQIVLNSLAFGRRRAREIMVPRIRVASLDLTHSMEKNREVMNERLYSRLPLCNSGMDNVVGVVHTKEFLSAYYAEGDSSVLQLIAHKPVFVPRTMTLEALMGVFHEEHAEMLFLVDEYGGVDGIVTLQDVVDELMGEVGEAPPSAVYSPPV
jgi:CBS domain containing-hemolysin-like protein